jgi:hypothetical protein
MSVSRTFLTKTTTRGQLYSRHYNHESAARALKLLIQEGDLRIICFLWAVWDYSQLTPARTISLIQ